MAGAMARQGAEGIDKFAESMNKVSAADQAKTRLDNLSGSIEKLKGTLDVMATNLGEKIGNQLRPAIEGLNNALSSMGDWWNNLSPAMQGAITTIGTIIAVLGGLVFAIGAVGMIATPLLGALSAIGTALAFLVSPI